MVRPHVSPIVSTNPMVGKFLTTLLTSLALFETAVISSTAAEVLLAPSKNGNSLNNVTFAAAALAAR